MIYHHKPRLTSTSTLAVACTSTVGSLPSDVSFQKVDPEKVLKISVLRDLGFTMEAFGIKPFPDGFYHGWISPFDVYDLFDKIDTVDIMKISECVVAPQEDNFRKIITIRGRKDLDGSLVEAGGFRLLVTTMTPQLILFGENSSLLNVHQAYLMNPNEVSPSAKL